MKPDIAASNRKAWHEYEIIDKYEAGIALAGSEVKSVRNHKANLQDSFCKVIRGEMFVFNMHIAPYEFTSHVKYDSKRQRKLLMHKTEIKKLEVKLTQRGLTLVPLEMFFTNRGICKLQLGLGKPLKKYDKRDKLKQRDIDREQQTDRAGRS
jgi:SsrA-binding protein